MLDAGIQLEPERARLVQSLSQTAPEQWRPEDVQRLKEGMAPAVSGIPQKRIFGSDYPYREAVQHLGLAGDGVGLEASLALGGGQHGLGRFHAAVPGTRRGRLASLGASTRAPLQVCPRTNRVVRRT